MMGWYEASKHALAVVTAAMRVEVAAFGIEVVLVEPGATDTPIWDESEADLERRRPSSAYRPAYDRALRLLRTARGRMGDPQAVAEAIGDALTTGHPSAHYRVGRDTPLVALTNHLLPASLKDKATRTVLGLRA